MKTKSSSESKTAKKATKKTKATAATGVTGGSVKKSGRGRSGRGRGSSTASSGKGRGRPRSTKLRIVESESELEDDFNAFGGELTPDRVDTVTKEPVIVETVRSRKQQQQQQQQKVVVEDEVNEMEKSLVEVEVEENQQIPIKMEVVVPEPDVPIKKDDKPMQLLNWSQKVNLIGEKVVNPLIHCCDLCLRPILIYGRMIPCKHVFCLACGKQDLKQCPRCSEKIARVEQTGLGSVFMCTHDGSRYGNDGCRRTYLSQRDLQAHINHRHVFVSKSIQ